MSQLSVRFAKASILWLQIFRNFATKKAAKTLQASKELGKLLNTAKLVKKGTEKMVANKRVLCVAEKNDAAKHISHILSKNHLALREGHSKFNKLYCFEGDVLGAKSNIVFTSVSGHLTTLEFDKAYKNWDQGNISALFSAPVIRCVPKNMSLIELTLKVESKSAAILIIWTDCDREGENIGAEVVSVCRQANPRIDVYRAKFSEITPRSINNAMQNLVRMDDRIVNAVDCRAELDLRIGAAFTRLQTLHLQKHFANILDGVISYGSCQFPTLGFVVERYKAIKSFISEQFWKLVGKDLNNKFDFSWERVRLFDMDATRAIHELCKEAKQAKVVLVDKHPKSKWRPQPLDTIEMEKLGIRKLKMTAKRVMAVAEKLYQRGLISYPRTETNKYLPSFNLREIVEAQTVSFEWGEFAAGILINGAPNPRNGNKSDQAHPPIHPTKYVSRNEIADVEEWRVYELVVRHFLASVSRNAKGQETDVRVEVGGEFFRATGIIVEDLGYLNVWTYDKWVDKTMPKYQLHQVLPKFVVTIASGQTEPPLLLTEADLIGLMDKHGIGTDATHAEHIEKIKERQYVALNADQRFVPGFLGLSLVDAYNEMGYEMSKPVLRAELESRLVEICNGNRTKDEVLQEQLEKYKRIFDCTEDRVVFISNAFRRYQNNRNN